MPASWMEPAHPPQPMPAASGEAHLMVLLVRVVGQGSCRWWGYCRSCATLGCALRTAVGWQGRTPSPQAVQAVPRPMLRYRRLTAGHWQGAANGWRKERRCWQCMRCRRWPGTRGEALHRTGVHGKAFDWPGLQGEVFAWQGAQSEASGWVHRQSIKAVLAILLVIHRRRTHPLALLLL